MGIKKNIQSGKKTVKTAEKSVRNLFSISPNEDAFEQIRKNFALLGENRSEYVSFAAAYPEVAFLKLRKARDRGLPEPLQWASLDYSAAVVRNSSINELSKRQDYVALGCPYLGVDHNNTHFDPGLEYFQRELAKAASDLFGLGKQQFVWKKPEPNRGFDAIRRSGLMLENRIIFVFTFYLSELRRPFWGVIPYARHRRIGIFFNSPKNAHFQRWQRISLSDRREISVNGIPRMSDSVFKWFKDLITDLDQQCTTGKDACLFTSEGFIDQEILQLLLAKYGPRDSTISLDRFVGPTYAYGDVGQFSQNLKDDQAMLFDLSDRPKLIGGAIIELPHGLDIRAGIGFSLAMWPCLREGENWQHLQRTAVHLLKQEKYEVTLQAAGIDVDFGQ